MLQVVYLLLHACLLSVAPCIPYFCSLLAYLLHACHSSLLIRLFAPRMPQALSLHAYLLHARHSSLLIRLFAPCMPQPLSPCSPICSMHAASSLPFHLFAPCMPRALPSSPICSMHATSSPLRCRPMHAHPLGLRTVGSLPPDPTVEPLRHGHHLAPLDQVRRLRPTHNPLFAHFINWGV